MTMIDIINWENKRKEREIMELEMDQPKTAVYICDVLIKFEINPSYI